jgi:hypothetical protein
MIDNLRHSMHTSSQNIPYGYLHYMIHQNASWYQEGGWTTAGQTTDAGIGQMADVNPGAVRYNL